MDNKIKYVDLNGLKMFAESLKQDLKNHVIELGLYQELLHRIENLELYKIVDLLPEKGDEDTIYLLKNPSGSGDKNVFIEYLYNNEHGWEEIGNFTPSFDLEDYLKIENASFEKGGSENSAVLKDGNNIAGLKGWYYKAIQFNTNTGNMYLYLTQTQQVPRVVTSVKDVSNPEKTISFNLPNGTVLSIINDVKYDNQFRLTGNDISKYGRIIVKPLSGEFPFNDIKTDDDLNNNKFDSEDYSVYSTDNPLSGIADMGEFSVAIGLNNKATNNKAVAFGYNNHSYGKFSFTEGRDNKAAYCSHAEGNETQANGLTSHSEGAGTQANGDMSHAEGKSTITTGKCSHAEGREAQAIGANSHAEGQLTMAIGNNSHASGYKTVANNNEEAAFGRFNKSNENTRFSIGIGTSEADRKNAFEVKENGDIYIKGLGGYEGNNSESSSNLSKVITDLDEVMNQKISKLIDNAPETYDTLKEISDYIAEDKDHAASVLTQLSKLDKKIDTKVKTAEPIQIAGGPLANDILDTDYWPDEWYETPGDKTTVRIIPSNTSFDDIIRTLFLRELYGTVEWNTPSWSPSVGQPSVSLSSSGSLEAGTKIKITKTTAGTVSGNTRSAKCTATYGYFLADAEGKPTGSHNTNTTLTVSKEGGSDNKVSYIYTWNGSSVNAGDDMQVEDNSNTLKVSQSGPTVSVVALPTTKVFASTNTKRVMSDEYAATLTDTKPSDKKLSNSRDYAVMGVRYAFTGAVASGFVANSANIRDLLTKNGTSKSALTKMTASEGNTQIIIAFPKTWGSLSEVKDNNALGAVITDKFKLTDNVKVEGANGFAAIDYKVYVYTSGVVLGAIDYSIIIK